ncbi:hypothetical protein [Limnohabitans lacus]|jgi:hypothetical protein|uniref:EGF-like domain-containing protein n=1 Tax=Limnohabitans lacus TaxID=3045173 RepID=A0ABT6X5P6_9BURK|nr:hypothetical protein [Limnohabitans sp. HM2-2]MDI9233435.1 hypothetical protein [Limnohabitans sp. HM2-2]
MEDERCCGTGTCIINPDGYCWCGQRWDGEKMCFPDPQALSKPSFPAEEPVKVKNDGAA